MKKKQIIAFLFFLGAFCTDVDAAVAAADSASVKQVASIETGGGTQTHSLRYLILDKAKSFVEQVTDSNYVYEIQDNFDLNGDTLLLPRHCTLHFNGGKVYNGHLLSNETQVTGRSPKLSIGNYIYDGEGREINTKTFTERRKKLKIHTSFSMFGQAMSPENLRDKYRMYQDCGINSIWLCLTLEYKKHLNVVRVPEWYTKYYELGGLKGTVRYLETRLGTKVDCVKLHKNYFFYDRPEETETYYAFCKQMIDDLADLGIGKIFISNEEGKRTKTGSIWVPCFNKIIAYAHSKGLKVGFSMNSFPGTVRSLDQSLVENVDMLYENFYPELSTKDMKTKYSDLPQMIKTCETEIKRSIRILGERNAQHKYGISECGVVGRAEALRHPYDWSDKSAIDKSGKIIDLYWRSVIPAALNTGVKEIANWYMDEYSRDRFKESTFNFMFDSIW